MYKRQIVKSVGDAVKKGDETLTGANGTKVIELVKENAKANPNADKDKVDEEPCLYTQSFRMSVCFLCYKVLWRGRSR